MPPAAVLEHVVLWIDRLAADRALLVEPLLFELCVALALRAPATRFTARADATADQRGGDHQKRAAAGQQRDVDAEHDVLLPLFRNASTTRQVADPAPDPLGGIVTCTVADCAAGAGVTTSL